MSTHKTTRDKILKHPIFEACKDLEVSPFWKALFEAYSYGQFPKGLIFQNDTLSYKKMKKVAMTCYVPADPSEALHVIKHFLRNEVGVISVDEITKKKIEMTIALRKNALPVDATWKEIRAPTTKQQMIALFCFKMMELCDMTPAETNSLFITINVGLICETITYDDIILIGGTISEIKGLRRDEYGFYTERRVKPVKLVLLKNEHKTKQAPTSKNWPKIRQQYAAYIGVK